MPVRTASRNGGHCLKVGMVCPPIVSLSALFGMARNQSGRAFVPVTGSGTMP